MRMRRTSAIVAVAVAMAAGLVGTDAAMAADPSDSPGVVVIGDRTFGPEDGLVIESGQVALGPTQPGMVSPMAATVFTRGTSYASTDHPTIISYVGKSRAMANIYNSQRVIRASYKYTRGDGDAIGWQHSNAVANANCTWTAGAENSHTVFDNLLPGTPVTTFHHDFVFLNPQAC